MLLSDLHPERITFYNDFFSTLSEQTIRTMESQAVGLLDRAAKPVSLDDILKSMAMSSPSNADQKKQLLSCILEHCPLVAATLDHRYFTYERGTQAFLAEVLKDLERPVHYRAVTNAFNDRLKSLSRKGAGFILEALNTAPLCHAGRPRRLRFEGGMTKDGVTASRRPWKSSCSKACHVCPMRLLSPFRAMKLIDKYLLRNLMVPLGYCLAAFALIYVVFDLFDNMSDFIDAKTPLASVLQFYSLLMPSVLIFIAPVSLFLAVLYSLSHLTKNNELTAMRSCGVSLLRLMTPMIAVGLIASVIVGVSQRNDRAMVGVLDPSVCQASTAQGRAVRARRAHAGPCQ